MQTRRQRERVLGRYITYVVRHGSQLVVVNVHPRDIGRILHLRRPRHQPKITHIQVKVHMRHPQRFQKRQDRVRPWAQRVSFFNVCTRLRLARTGARLGPLALRTRFPALQIAADCNIEKCAQCACVARKSHQRVCQGIHTRAHKSISECRPKCKTHRIDLKPGRALAFCIAFWLGRIRRMISKGGVLIGLE